MPPLKVGAKTYYVETFFQVTKAFHFKNFSHFHYYNKILFQANWFRANQFCRYQGMELASLSNKEEDDKLLVALQATCKNSKYLAKIFF